MSEGLTGNMKLEVIADDTYFVPWESEFEVETSKQVQVEVKQQRNKKAKVVMEKVKPSATATIVTKRPKKLIEVKDQTRSIHLRTFAKQLVKEGVTLSNIRKHKKRINELSNNLILQHNITEDTRKWIVNSTLRILAKRSKK